MSFMEGDHHLMDETAGPLDYRGVAATIVSAYISRNPVPAAELPKIIETVCHTLLELQRPEVGPDLKSPRVQALIAASVTDRTITCLLCGKELQMLKRHVMARHNLTVDEYRNRFGLSDLYPDVAPFYSRFRSKRARDIGLGRKPDSLAGSERPGTDDSERYVVV
jgi:predicted transcriptional regulator